MKVGYLQNIQSFETSVETGNLQSYEKQSILTAVKVTLPILTAVKVTLQLEQVPLPFPPPPPPPSCYSYWLLPGWDYNDSDFILINWLKLDKVRWNHFIFLYIK